MCCLLLARRAGVCGLSIAIALAVLTMAAQNERSGTATPGVLVRPANTELLGRATGQFDKVQRATQKLSERVGAAGKLSDPQRDALKAEVAAAYRELRAIDQLTDELLLRGEIDGLILRQRAGPLAQALADAVAKVRPQIGTPASFAAFVNRRASQQTGLLRQVDELMQAKKWAEARKRLLELLDEADKVGVFVDAAESKALYGPIRERLDQAAAALLEDARAALRKDLLNEFTSLRPDFKSLVAQFDAAGRSASAGQPIRWDTSTVAPAELLDRVATAWREIDRRTVRAAAVLHCIGATAQPDLRVFAAEYQEARTRALALPREVMAAEAETLAASDAESRYRAYLAALPRFMAALRATPADLQSTEVLLRRIAARSPELTAQVDSYRTATEEVIRWRRRLAQRYLQIAHARYGDAIPLAATADPSGTGLSLRGATSSARFNQTVVPFRQSPDQLTARWTESWRGAAVVVSGAYVVRPGSETGTLVGSWHGRTTVEVPKFGPGLKIAIDALRRDLLCADAGGQPLTLDAAMALHTAVNGPYLQAGVQVEGATVVSLTDRLWDQAEPSDLPLATDPGTLAGATAFPACALLQGRIAWIAHELFVEIVDLPRIEPPPAHVASQPPAKELPTPPPTPPAKKQPTAKSQPPAKPQSPSATPKKALPPGAKEL